MSKLYGTLQGDRGAATRTGYKKITAAAQSYDGSVITEFTYVDDVLMVRVSAEKNESTTHGKTLFYGTFDEYIEKLR